MTTNQHAVEVDTKIAETYRTMIEANAKAQSTLESLMCAAAWNARKTVQRTNSRSDYRTHLWIDNKCVRATFPVLVPYLDDDEIDRATNVQAAMSAARDAYLAAEADYEGWSRFFLVNAGHIHRSMSCSSCNKGRSATVFTWLPELSGLTEADAVAAHGAHLCTVCFPTAPTEWHHKKGAK